MIELKEHLKSILKDGFTVANTKSNKIILFDLDDTIIHTTAEIGVVKDGVIIKKLSNSQFNDYKLKDGESFDFGEFDDPTILSKSVFTPYWETLKREYNKGTHIGILTARGDAKMIKQFFLDNGIRIKNELVMAVGDPNSGLRGSIQEKKAKMIGYLVDIGYKTFVFFDDNEPNLIAAKALEKRFPIKVQTVKV